MIVRHKYFLKLSKLNLLNVLNKSAGILISLSSDKDLSYLHLQTNLGNILVPCEAIESTLRRFTNLCPNFKMTTNCLNDRNLFLKKLRRLKNKI